MEQTIPQYTISRIKSSYPYFSEKERLIADYILEKPQKVLHSTISQIAEDLQIADATVFRFCKRIGFKGYQEMKIALASELVTPIKDIHETINEEDSEIEVAEKVFVTNIKALEDTIQVVKTDAFADVVNVLLHARTVHFYGNGGSGVIAMDAHHKFLRTGINSCAYTDSHMQLMAASQLTEEDVIVFISHSGTNKDILEVLEVARENNVPTVAITNLAKTPLGQRVDHALFTVSQETEYRSEALASRIAELSIIDALYVNISIARKEYMKTSLQKMRKAISYKRI